jgi:hypothetical protein
VALARKRPFSVISGDGEDDGEEDEDEDEAQAASRSHQSRSRRRNWPTFRLVCMLDDEARFDAAEGGAPEVSEAILAERRRALRSLMPRSELDLRRLGFFTLVRYEDGLGVPLLLDHGSPYLPEVPVANPRVQSASPSSPDPCVCPIH